MADWENTTAIGSGQGLVYTVADNETERERIFKPLESDLEAATGANGDPIETAFEWAQSRASEARPPEVNPR